MTAPARPDWDEGAGKGGERDPDRSQGGRRPFVEHQSDENIDRRERNSVPGALPGALIITAELPLDLHHRFTELRRAHYPAERNWLNAHVTLFRALPPSVEGEVHRLLSRIASEYQPVAAQVGGVMALERGTALAILSPDMLDIREFIGASLHTLLTDQDRHRPKIHVTIQNGVPAADAKALQRELVPMIERRNFAFPALALHRYEGGPWSFVRRFVFRG